MPRFLTRVELYGSSHSGPEYEALHREMVRRQFHRFILGDGRIVADHLPPAEYWSWGMPSLNASGVRALALEAAAAIGYWPWPGQQGDTKLCAVVTVEAGDIAWSGLKPTTLYA